MTVATAYKPLTADCIEDTTLGAFGNLRPSETLNHLIRYLSTWSGSDKLFMGGLSNTGRPTSSIAPKLAKLASIIGSARSLWDYALSFLRTNVLVPSASHLPTPPGGKPRRVATHDGAVSLWSTRLWMAYVVLQLAHLREDRALEKLSAREKLQLQERAELARRWDAWYNELAVNLSYLSMTIHGSLEKGLFGNSTWVSLFGFAAAIASFRSGWKATAEPSEDVPEVSDIALVTNDTDSSPQ
ncbi:hypothetical protein EDB86DRAFT_3082430 [Lactarius hatsudake]|nr:hypothetical protein EDB86DRAFT_3082430 [Lactarius hatsudake]